MPPRVLVCTRCGHRWIPQVSHPVMCPNCHSKYWDKPYTRSDIVLSKGLIREVLS